MSETFTYDFPMAGNTSTALIFNSAGQVLLGLRGEDSDAYPNWWSFPGGYLNVGTERMIDVVSRETKEETNLDIANDKWKLFYSDDKPGSDPRYTQVVNLCYHTTVSQEVTGKLRAGDDLAAVKWVSIEEAMNTKLAFTHNEIIEEYYNM